MSLLTSSTAAASRIRGSAARRSRLRASLTRPARRDGGGFEVVLRFLSSYLLVLVLPLVIVSFVNGKFITLMAEDARQANLSILEQCRDTLDGRLAEIGSMIASLSLNADIGSLIASTDSIDRIIMKVARAQRDLYPYIATNSFLSDFFIYLRNSNAILSPFTAYIRLENVYGGVIKYGDMDYAQFHTRLLNGYHSKEYLPSVPVMLDGKTRAAILCVQSIPLGFVSDVKANLLFFIDEERIRELLARLRLDEGGWAYIADREGRVLVSIGRDREGIGADELGAARQKKIVESTYSGKKMIVSCTVSASNEWTYVAAVPYAVVMSRVEGVRRLSFFVVAGMVLAGFAASITLAFRSSKPLRNVMGLLEGSLGDCKYGQLEDSVSELISRNESMSKSAQEQLPILRSAFLDRLLRGEFASAREVEASMAQAGLSIGGSSYAVLLIRIDGYRESATREVLEELRLKKAAVREAFQSYFDGALLLHDVGAGSISALLCFEGQEVVPEEELEAEMRRAVGALESERCIKVSLGMGRRYVDLVDVTSSYYEASEVLERGSPGRIALYRDGEKNEGGYSYPIDRELRLMNLVRAGDGARAKELLDAIRAENASRGALSREVVSLFLFELRGTLTKLLALPGIAEAEWSAGMAASLGAIRHEEDLGTSFDAYAALFLAMCDAIGAQKKSHNSLMRTKMVERVKERFPDANFGLGAIADEFEVTEVYASQFFKEQTGENFSAYLERVRMEKARELLETTDITINDLAAKVGYNSAHAFRRAYKRVNGVIPTSLRDTRLGRNL